MGLVMQEYEGHDRTAHILSELERIEAMAKAQPQEKVARFVSSAAREVAHKELKRIGWLMRKDSQELPKDAEVSTGHYLWLMNRYRRSIKAANHRHHNANEQLAAIAARCNKNPWLKKYPDAPHVAKLIDPALSLDKLRSNMLKLLRDRNSPHSNSNSEIHKALAKVQLEHALYYALEPLEVARQARKDASREALEVKQVEKQFMIHGRRLVAKAWLMLLEGLALGAEQVTINKAKYSKLRAGKAVPQLVTAIALITGRRFSEVAMHGNFEPMLNKPGYVLFSGQMKTKNRRLLEIIKPYEIPVLALEPDDIEAFKTLMTEKEQQSLKNIFDKLLDATGKHNGSVLMLMDAIKLLRKLMKKEIVKYVNDAGQAVEVPVLPASSLNMSHTTAVARKFAKGLNEKISRELLEPDLQFKDSRAIAARIACNRYAEVQEEAFYPRYLGHTGSVTQLYYKSWVEDMGINSIVAVTSRGEEEKPQQAEHTINSLLVHLVEKTPNIQLYLRAPNWVVIHNYLLKLVDGGLTAEKIIESANATDAKSNRNKTTPCTWLASLIRKNVMPNGKSLPLATIKSYLFEQENGLQLGQDGEVILMAAAFDKKAKAEAEKEAADPVTEEEPVKKGKIPARPKRQTASKKVGE